MIGRYRMLTALVLALAIVLAAGAVPAATNNRWAGNNGVVRFSFVAGDSLVSVQTAPETIQGLTKVDLYAWLTDFEPISVEKIAFLRIGAFEMRLRVEGGEPEVFAPEIPGQGLNIGQDKEEIIAAVTPGYEVGDGRVLLAHWVLLFRQPPADVRFSLDAVASRTCAGTPGCTEAAPDLVFVSTRDSDINQYVFGAVCEPAWLAPTGEPDQSPTGDAHSWREVGLAEAR